MVPISNDQVFKHVFGNDKELCRRLVELALGRPISSIEYLDVQHESSGVSSAGATYFDVLAMTETGEVIDVEMQASPARSLEFRGRVYLSRMTVDGWTRVKRTKNTRSYADVPRVALIFICGYDPLGDGCRRYTLRTRCVETDRWIDDGSIVVWLNAFGSGDDIDPELAAFLAYVAGDSTAAGKSDFVRTVADRVVATNEDHSFVEGVMDLEQKLWESHQDGVDEGMEKGLERGMEEGAQKNQALVAGLARAMSADGRGSDEIADALSDVARFEEELGRYGIRD